MVHLRLDEEEQVIEKALRHAQQRDRFELKQCHAVRTHDLQSSMLDIKPNIVHFCGHGTGEEGLVFQDETGRAKLVSTDALANLFRLFDHTVECVVLNACYAEVQAEAISKHIRYVVGMHKAIGDRAAIEFSRGFYDALGVGESIERAFEFGCNAIQLEGIPEHLTPVLKINSEISLPTSVGTPCRTVEKPSNMGITWLHLSDWHEGAEGVDKTLVPFDRLKVVLPKLIEDIKNRSSISPDLSKIDFIVFSGDIAFSGEEKQYKDAWKNLFAPVLEAAGLDSSRLFIVPGNHDLDQTRKDKYSPSEIQKTPDQLGVDLNIWMNRWLNNEEDREFLLLPFKAFRKFAAEHTLQKSPDYGSTQTLDINGIKIGLLGLNSALLSDRNKVEINGKKVTKDEGELIVGEYQILNSLSNELKECDVKIVVLHHPLEYLKEDERERIDQLIREDFHFVLYGHRHRGGLDSKEGTVGKCIYIPAGSSYAGRGYSNGYNFVNLNFETQEGKIYFRCWGASNSWRKDIDICAPDGVHSWNLSQALQKINKSYISNITSSKLDQLERELQDHYIALIDAIREGLVVPFLGSDINLCDRPGETQTLKPWDWDLTKSYPPTNLELAAYIDKQYGKDGKNFLERVQCPLCSQINDSHANAKLPDQCPINTGLITRLDLRYLAQFFDSQEGSSGLKVAIEDVSKNPFKSDYPFKPNCLHRFLAKLPKMMLEDGSLSKIKGGKESNNTKYQLIVTTNFDRTLERAFIEEKQPFDLISFSFKEDMFIHQPFDHKDPKDSDSELIKPGKPIPISDPDKYGDNGEFDLNIRPIILRLYGPPAWEDFPGIHFTITEDQFLNYLVYDPSKKMPATLRAKFHANPIWFLGYSLSSWHLRSILNRILIERKDGSQTSTWWSVQEKADLLDEKLWEVKNALFIHKHLKNNSLSDYIHVLERRFKGN